MRYLILRRREDLRELGYRIYMSDAVQMISESAAKFGGGPYLTRRWADAIERSSRPEDDRSAEEIIADIAEKAGLEIV